MRYYEIVSTGEWCLAENKNHARFQFSAKCRRVVASEEIQLTTASKVLDRIQKKFQKRLDKPHRVCYNKYIK